MENVSFNLRNDTAFYNFIIDFIAVIIYNYSDEVYIGAKA